MGVSGGSRRDHGRASDGDRASAAGHASSDSGWHETRRPPVLHVPWHFRDMVSHADFWHVTSALDQLNILMVTIGIAKTFFQPEFFIHAKKFRTGQPPVVRGATSIGNGVRSVPSGAPPRVLKRRADRIDTLYLFYNSPYLKQKKSRGCICCLVYSQPAAAAIYTCRCNV